MSRDRQRGFSIVAAIFILVVLAALGGFVVTVSTAQHAGTAMDVQGARAYQAARAGAEWGAYAVLPLDAGAPPALPFGTTCQEAAYGAPVANNLTINGFGVTVRCGRAAFTDGGNFNVYQIEATACSPANGGACPNSGAVGSLAYVERRVSITVTDSP